MDGLLTIFVFDVRLKSWTMRSLKPWFVRVNWLICATQQNSTENISWCPQYSFKSSWKLVLQPFVRINLSFFTKTNVRNELQCSPLLEKQGFSEIYILSMAWILGKGKSSWEIRKRAWIFRVHWKIGLLTFIEWKPRNLSLIWASSSVILYLLRS